MSARKPCAALFMTPVIQWNGDVTTCCYDPLMELKIGNINKQTIEEIWYSDEMQKRRILQIMGDFSYPEKCSKCKNVDGIQITDDEVFDYLKHINREDLIPLYCFNHGINPDNEDVIYINPEELSDQKWDKIFYHYKGEDGFNKGNTHFQGYDSGFFQYKKKFSGPRFEVSKIVVSAHLATPVWDDTEQKGVSNKSEVELILNHKSLGKNTVYPIMQGKGRMFSWVLKDKAFIRQILDLGELTLSFNVAGTGGLCVLGKPLNHEDKYFPVSVRFVNRARQNAWLESKSKQLLKTPSQSFKAICSAPWKSPTINWNGDVTVCCKDDNMQLKAGNILKQDFNELWWENQELNQYRLNHIEGKLSTIPLCSSCRFKDDITIDKMHARDIKVYLKYLQGGKTPEYEDNFVTIELTNRCNMECIMCPQASGSLWRLSQGKFGFMKLKDFKAITHKLEGCHFRDLVLFWFGEPLLHPHFREIISHLSKKRFYKRIIIHTNALLLDKATTEQLVSLDKLLMIHFSLDAATRETYDRIRKKGNFGLALKNIKHFLKQKRGKPNITAVLQFIVMEENKHELLAFREYWARFFKEQDMKYTVATMKHFNSRYTNFIFFRKLANQSFISGKGFREVTDEFYENQVKRLRN